MSLKLNFKPKLFYVAVALCSISILASSCIKSSGNSPISAGPGGGSDGGGSGSGSASGSGSGSASGSGSEVPDNSLIPKVPEKTACETSQANFCVTEEIASQSIQIPFTPTTGSIKGFNASLADGTTSEWKVDFSACSGTVSGTCNITLTYRPIKSTTGIQTVNVNYTYINNNGHSPSTQQQISPTYQAISLLNPAQTLTLPEGNLSQISQLSFSNYMPTYFLNYSSKKFYSLGNPDNPVVSIKSFALAPYTDATKIKAILTDNTPSTPNFYIYDPAGGATPTTKLQTMTEDLNLSTFAVGKSSIYGCSYNGKIYFIDPSPAGTAPIITSPSVQIPAPNNIINTCTTDTSSQTGDIVYALSMDSFDPTIAKEYLCSITTSSKPPIPVCYNTSVLQVSDVNQNMLATNGIVYVESTHPYDTDTPITMTMNAYTASTDGTSLVQYSGFNPVTIPNFYATSPLVYGASPSGNKKMIYAVYLNGSTYQLAAIDAATGGVGSAHQDPVWTWTQPLSPKETLSSPFITTNGNILIVSSTGNIYGLKNDGSPVFTSGPTYSDLTHILNFASLNTKLVAVDTANKNMLDIPVTLTDGTTFTYPLNIQW